MGVEQVPFGALLRRWRERRRMTQALLAEVAAYPAPPQAAPPASLLEGADRFATPLRLATPAGPVSFVNTTTVFGTPTNVTLAELALEMLFPADDESADTIRRLMNDDDARLKFERAFAAANPGATL